MHLILVPAILTLAVTLLRLVGAFGLAVRIPVVLVMLVAIFGGWGTHYDVAPPG